MKIFALPLLAALLGISCGPLPTPSQNAQLTPGAIPADMQASGAFDYYLLTLSWAPEFCYSKPNNPECSGHVGFIVHGLWPQYSRGGYPENCGQQAGPSNPQGMLDLMPDLHLIEHEWMTHGTCTGLAADNYFALIRRIRNSVKIPQDLAAPDRQLSMSPEGLKQDFEQANRGLTDAGMAVSCGSGPYLVAVEICFSKDGRLTQCGGDIRDCNRQQLRIPRVQ